MLRLDGDLDATEETFRSLLDDPEAEPGIRARALAGLGLIKVRRGDLRATVALLEEAIGAGHLPPDERPDVYEELAKALAEFKAGKDSAINAFKGPVMKAAKGKANPKLVDETLRKLLAN